MGERRLTVVLGGARSGKSAWAETLARRAAEARRAGGKPSSVTYVATARVYDEEMARRVRLHQERRPAGWRTVEAPAGLADAVTVAGQDGGIVLVDCLTLYVSNVLMETGESAGGHGENIASARDEEEAHRRVAAEVDAFVAACRGVPADVIVVTNEVGEGVVPAYPLGRLFRDVAGWANQRIAGAADAVYVVFAGIPVEIKKLSAAREATAAREVPAADGTKTGGEAKAAGEPAGPTDASGRL